MRMMESDAGHAREGALFEEQPEKKREKQNSKKATHISGLPVRIFAIPESGKCFAQMPVSGMQERLVGYGRLIKSEISAHPKRPFRDLHIHRRFCILH
jgi:hypothetical protein